MGMIKEAIIEAMSTADKFELIRWRYENGKLPMLDSFADVLMSDFSNDFDIENTKKILYFVYRPDEKFYSFSFDIAKNICEIKKIRGNLNKRYVEVWWGKLC